MLRFKHSSRLAEFVRQCKICIAQIVNRGYENEYEVADEDTADERYKVEDERIDIDKMDGGTFEHFCADLLRVNGWTDVRVTPASGDHGIDITAEKDDIKWGFQCKRWGDTKVDAIAIGQTYKGKALYECDMVAVITTSTLTAQAEGEAKQLGIKVWGRGKIRQLMSKLDNADDYYLSAQPYISPALMRSLAVAAQQAINNTEKEKALVTAALVARQLQVLLLCCALLRRWQISLKSKTKHS